MLEMKQYPTQIALACLIASRTVNEIRPAWNSKFRYILNYTQEEIQPCVDLLLKKYHEYFGQKLKLNIDYETNFQELMMQTYSSTQFPSSSKNTTAVK